MYRCVLGQTICIEIELEEGPMRGRNRYRAGSGVGEERNEAAAKTCVPLRLVVSSIEIFVGFLL